MRYPNFKEERKLWKRGYRVVVGLDEAGRGPLAGPVVAAAVFVKKFSIFNFQPSTRAKPRTRAEHGSGLSRSELRSTSGLGAGLVPHRNEVSGAGFSKIKDSKKLTPKKRKEFFKILTKNPNIKWGIGWVSEKVIDKINILEATKLAMRRAIKNLGKRVGKKAKESVWQKSHDRGNFGQLNFLIIDGNFNINLNIPQKSIVKADEKVFSCAAASIVAKVSRDRMMLRYQKKYPQYGFAKHKGYPTKLHRKMLKKHGPSVIHRLTFSPIKKRI